MLGGWRLTRQAQVLVEILLKLLTKYLAGDFFNFVYCIVQALCVLGGKVVNSAAPRGINLLSSIRNPQGRRSAP
jgi:hypothetical protein